MMNLLMALSGRSASNWARWSPLLLAVVLEQGVVRADDWPTFLGPTRDGVIHEAGLKPWPNDHPPTVRWRKSIGAGYAGPIVASNRVLLFYQVDQTEVVELLDSRDGTSLWKTEYPTEFVGATGSGPGPRSTPTIVKDMVVTMGAEGTLQNLDFKTGKVNWRRPLHREFQIRPSYFGIGSSPLVEGGAIVVNLGARGGAFAAFSLATGETRWTSGQDEASYASPVAADLEGERRIVVLSRSGVNLLEPPTGRVTAFFPWRSRSQASVHGATPIVFDHHLFASSCYDTGSVLLKAGPATLAPVWTSREYSNHYDTSVRVGDHLYGIDGRQDFGEGRLCAVDWKTGKIKWTVDGFGCAHVLASGSRLLIWKEDGTLVWARASSDQYAQERSSQLARGLFRAAPAISGGSLYARNEEELFAIELNPAR